MSGVAGPPSTADVDPVAVPGVRVERPEPGVAVVVLDRPERLNAMSLETMLGLPSVLDELAADADVRAIVVTGAGGAFSAGGDLETIGALPEFPADELNQVLQRFFRASISLHEMDKPTIAAVAGPCAGGGLGLALACDIRLAGPRAVFVSPFINMGIGPDYCTTWLLPRVVGNAAAMEMALTGRRVGADEALTLGLVSRLCGDPLADAVDLAHRIAMKPAPAVQLTKRLIRDSATIDLSAGARAEADAQTVALKDREFAALWSAWQGTISGA